MTYGGKTPTSPIDYPPSNFDWRVTMGGKIVDAQLAEKVKALRDEGKTQDQIAVELRIVQSTVSIILRQCGLGGRLTSARKLQR